MLLGRVVPTIFKPITLYQVVGGELSNGGSRRIPRLLEETVSKS